MIKSIIWRFVKGFISGAVASMIAVATTTTNSWADLGVWVNGMVLAGMVGGITGILLAIQKWLSWTDEPTQ